MSTENDRQHLWKLIGKCKFAMFVTNESVGLRSRPMTTIQQRDFDGNLWFFAATDSAVVKAIRTKPQVCLSYGNTNEFDFVSVAGTASALTDVAQKKALWSPAVQAWFPQGPESPSVCLVKVAADHAEYWDSTSSKLVQIFSMAKALATDSQPRGIGEHREVSV